MAEPKAPAKPKSFAATLAAVAKKYDTRVGTLSAVATDVTAITTGNIAIDTITGVGGLPRGRSVELYGPPSCGKSLAATEMVLTPTGPVEIQNLIVGDSVVSPEGVSSVLGVYPQGPLPTVEVQLRDGRTVRCSEDHLWTWAPRQDHGVLCWRTTTTAQMRMWIESRDRAEIQLPPVGPVDYSRSELPVDPYVVGLLLGDGSTVRGVRFYSGDPELFVAMKNLAPSDVEFVSVLQPSRVDGVTAKGMWRYLRPLGMMGKRAWEKSLPEEYKWTSASNRLSVLQGLMDTDGGVSEGRGEFSSSSERLAADVAWLVRSLGGSARVSTAVSASGRLRYRVGARMPEGVMEFRLERKRALLRTVVAPVYVSKIVDSEPAECVCIEVSAESKLFLTADCVPTHNTTTALQAAAELQKRIIAGDPEVAKSHILYMDHEQAMDSKYAKALGLDVDHPSFLFSQPDTFEDGANISRELIKTGDIALVIFDSVASMIPATALEAETGKASVALQARLMSDFLKQLNALLKDTKTTAVFLNHIAEVIDMGGRPGVKRYTTPGGRALKFYASVRMEFQQIKNHQVTVPDELTREMVKVVTSSDVRVRVIKNKVAPPFKQCVVRVRFGRGFDNGFTAVQILKGRKLIIEANSGYNFFDRLPELTEHMPKQPSGNKRPYLRGEPAMFAFMDEHPEFREALITRAIAELASPETHELLEVPPEELEDALAEAAEDEVDEFS